MAERDLGVVILAAGASSRLGRPKQLVVWRGKPLVAWAVEAALAAELGPVAVVVGAEAAGVAAAIAPYDVRVIHNPRWADGQGASIAAGVGAIAAQAVAGVAGVAIVLCDQPGLTAAHLQALAAQWRQPGVSIAASAYADTLGVPAIFGRAHFAELQALAGTQGAKGILVRHAQTAAGVAFPAGTWDVDTPADVEALAGFPNN